MTKRNTKTRKSGLTRKPNNGTVIILGGGSGRKAVFNQRRAIVLDYPSHGSWLKVGVMPVTEDDRASAATTDLRTLAWRKGGVNEERKDPVKILNDHVCQIIFSFIFGDGPSKTTATATATTTTTAAERVDMIEEIQNRYEPHEYLRTAVCSQWMATLHRIIPTLVGPVHVNLYWSQWRSKMTWLCRNRIRISSLQFDLNLSDIPYLCKLLKHCHTDQLTYMRAIMNKQRAVEMYSGRLTSANFFFDLDREEEYMNQPRIPASAQKLLHDCIVENCPQLVELVVSVTLVKSSLSTCEEYISDSLFSMSSIIKLKIVLGYHPDNTIERPDERIFCRLIQNLSGLKRLELVMDRQQHGTLHFPIRSETLEELDIYGLGKDKCISCHCPRLQKFRCNGDGYYGSGTLPVLSRDQYDRLDEYCGSDGHLTVSADTFSFPNFQVPNTCEMTFDEFSYWSCPGFYEDYCRQVARVARLT